MSNSLRMIFILKELGSQEIINRNFGTENMNNLSLFSLKSNLIAILLLMTAVSYSQNASDTRLQVTAELGTGVLFGPSNLSAWGVDYRNEYNSGFTGNVKALYRLNKILVVGLKYSLFVASENYELSKDERVADDVSLNYIAPQIGCRRMINEKFIFGYAIGAGYLRYDCKSRLSETEYKFNSASWGANADFTLDYQLLECMAIGFDISLMGGNRFKKLNETVGDAKEVTLHPEKWDRLKVMRADFLLGVKVSF